MKTPDVLVLGAGGILGEAWTSSLLAGLDEGRDFEARRCGAYVGTSAGSIVAAMLCAGVDPRSGLGELPEPPSLERGEEVDSSPVTRALRLGAAVGSAATGPLAATLIRTSVPGGRLLRRAALARVSRGRRSLENLGREVEQRASGWDGRLAITAVELESGRRVIFDGSDSRISVADAVRASCAIPGVFEPLVVDGRSYVDGGAWSTTNIDVAPAEPGAELLCLNPTGALRSRSGPLALLGPWSRMAAAVEASAMRRRGARVRVIGPDARSAAAMGPNLMDARARPRVVAAGIEQGRALQQS